MKRKKGICLFGLFLFLMGVMPSSVLAEEASNLTTTVAEAKSPVTFQINSSSVQIGVKDALVQDLVIKESYAGALEKNKVIYLQAETLKFESGAEAEVVSGDIKMGKVKTKDGLLAIEIDKASSEASEIKITNLKLFLDRNLPQGSYGIDLIVEAGEDYPKNLFGENYGDDDEPGKFSRKTVRLLDDFIILEDGGQITNPQLDEEAIFFRVSATIGEKEIVSKFSYSENGKKVPLKEAAYCEDGLVMLPFRAIAEELDDSIMISWDQTSQSVTVFMGKRIASVTVGSNQMVINGTTIPMTGKVEMKNGIVFLPLQDLGLLFGMKEDQIQWNEETRTASLNDSL